MCAFECQVAFDTSYVNIRHIATAIILQNLTRFFQMKQAIIPRPEYLSFSDLELLKSRAEISFG